MSWPTMIFKLAQECKGVMNGLVFALLLFGVAAIVRAARSRQ